jgi:hypothetical protein
MCSSRGGCTEHEKGNPQIENQVGLRDFLPSRTSANGADIH